MIPDDFLVAPLADCLKETLFTITTEKENAVVAGFLDWLTNKARLKPVPDLQDRITKMGPRLRKLAENLEVRIKDGKLVVKADAESETLLNQFRYGTNWFEPHPDVNAAILSALADGANAT